MADRNAPCGCPWDGVACPHCGKGGTPDHVRRHHEAAIRYPARTEGPSPALRYPRFQEPRVRRG